MQIIYLSQKKNYQLYGFQRFAAATFKEEDSGWKQEKYSEELTALFQNFEILANGTNESIDLEVIQNLAEHLQWSSFAKIVSGKKLLIIFAKEFHRRSSTEF